MLGFLLSPMIAADAISFRSVSLVANAWLLLGLVIAALLVYFLVFRDNGKNTEAVTEADYITNTNEPDLLGVKENNETVAVYVNFVENSKEKMSLDHAYTNEALLKLTDATNAMANEV